MSNNYAAFGGLLLLALCLSSCPKSDSGAGGESNATPAPATATPQANPCDDGTADDAAANPCNPCADAANPCDAAENPCMAENPCALDPALAALVMAPVEHMAEAMRDYYAAGFAASFHPESPVLATQQAFYNEWKKTNQHVEIGSLTVLDHNEDEATLDYELVYTQRPGNEEVRRESGTILVVLDAEGNWVIMDMQANS